MVHLPGVSPNRELTISSNGLFFTKEILAYVQKTFFLFVDWKAFERIEYGSLANDKELFDDQLYHSTLPTTSIKDLDTYVPRVVDLVNSDCDLRGDYNRSLPARLFIQGKCVELVLCGGDYFLCELCLMHQYGLHRTRDKINETCMFESFPLSFCPKICFG